VKDDRIYLLISKGFGPGINFSEMTLEDFFYFEREFKIMVDQKRKKVILEEKGGRSDENSQLLAGLPTLSRRKKM